MDAQSDGKQDRYLLGDSAPELAHLVAQAEVTRPRHGSSWT